MRPIAPIELICDDPAAMIVGGKVVMGSFSIWHWLVFLGVVLLLFGGKGKISNLMGDVAQGVKAFKKGLQDEPPAENLSEGGPKVLSVDAGKPAAPAEKDVSKN